MQVSKFNISAHLTRFSMAIRVAMLAQHLSMPEEVIYIHIHIRIYYIFLMRLKYVYTYACHARVHCRKDPTIIFRKNIVVNDLIHTKRHERLTRLLRLIVE